ncbi:MAG: molybdopterin cofactor-binding domain-containing protein [Burkholderiales bacterium]
MRMVLGNTASAPNQGATIASASIQIHAAPLRAAAAQARGWLLERASELLGAQPRELQIEGGVVRFGEGTAHAIDFGQLVAEQHVALDLDPATPPKRASEHRIVGTSLPRTDIPAKATGALVFVHDLRVPGMLHGRVVRPPYAGADHGDFIGNTLESVDEKSIAHIPGIRAVVVIRDFVGIVAEREEHAEQALRELVVRWKPWPALPDTSDLARALSANPATRRKLVDEGDVDAALAGASQRMARRYVWPYQLHASIGPSCAVADWKRDDRGDGRSASQGNGQRAGHRGDGLDRHGDAHETRLTVWVGSQNPHVLRADLARLMDLPDVAVDVIRMEAAGCYGRNSADDVAADAALLSRAVGAPVRVQLTREQEHLWEPKGAAQLMDVDGGLAEGGAPAAYDFQTSYPSNAAPTLALLLTRTIDPGPHAFEMGDRTARPPYAYANLRVTVNDMAPILRASWLRGVSALPNSFAHESYVDELASAAKVDPVAYRLGLLHDERAAELLQATADKAGWRPHTEPMQQPPDGLWLRGQGVAYARYVHSKWPGFGAAWSAWVADVEVHRETGEVQVRKVVVGQDAGLVVNPKGVEHQLHGNVLQTTSRALFEQLPIEPKTNLPAAREWGSYPILKFSQVPVIEVVVMPRPGEPALGVGESASVPGTAAIANAIFDATGVRLREPPFTPERMREAMGLAGARWVDRQNATTTLFIATNDLLTSSEANFDSESGSSDTDARPDQATRLATTAARPSPSPSEPSSGSGSGSSSSARTPSRPEPGLRSSSWSQGDAPWPRHTSLLARGGAVVFGLVGLLGALLGWRPTIAPVSPSSASVYTQGTIERGRQLAALGDCKVCHTADGGAENAGGRPLETPFGTLHATNITPDVETGIGAWSFSAFQRAMRDGIARDGRHLYPAFPYTAFAKTSDDDLIALYSYLMSQPAARADAPINDLRFPFNVRPLLAIWNGLFHDPTPLADNPDRSAEWNRGAYLVNGVGHCGACHTPRNALGAERGGSRFLAGAMVEGWEAPALTASSNAPVPWSADALFNFLRHGHSREHGSALGPMAPVVRELAKVPDADIRAMATYLASFNTPLADTEAGPRANALAQAAGAGTGTSAILTPATLPGPGQRLFDNACAACHHDGDGPKLLGVNTPLALSTKLHSDQPDNLIRTILDGVQEPAGKEIGFMAGFRDALSDAQIEQLASYMRARFAPGKGEWVELRAAVARARVEATAQ